jgi:CheY-like chemotaxis protein
VSKSQRARLVVADDHPDVLQAVTSMLERACDVVAAVGDGVDAVRAVQRLNPDVIVLDVAMPRVNGFQAAGAIRSQGHRTPVVFLSAHADDESVIAGLAAGQAFVSKTRMNDDLLDAVRHVRAGRTFAPVTRVLPRLNRSRICRHDLHLYVDDGSLVESIAAYFSTALQIGDALVAVATPSHLQALETAMRAIEFRLDRLMAEGRYATLDAAAAVAAVMVDGKPDARRFTEWLGAIVDRGVASAPSGRVTIFGEMAPSLTATQVDAALALETIADDFASSRPVAILCGYGHDSGCESDVPFDPIFAAHSTVVPAGPHP